MRVLIATEDLPAPLVGGAGKHALLLARALAEAGHEVELLARRHPAGLSAVDGHDGPVHFGIELGGTGWQEYRFGAFLPWRREHAARRVWHAMRALVPERYDVLHYHGHLYALGHVVPAGLPFVQTLHDQGADCLTMTRRRAGAICTSEDPADCAGCATPAPNAVQRRLSEAAVLRHREVSRRAAQQHEMVFVSAFLRRAFEQRLAPGLPLRATVVHNFTHARALAAVQAARHDGGRPLLVMAGRVDATKGFGEFLQAMGDARRRAWAVRVLGDGPQLAELRARHEPEGVVFHGFVDQAEVYRWTAAADACVVPSVWEEPCGTAILEGLSLGRPVLALARGGTPELACYERWPGQLRLADDLPALAARLDEPLRRMEGVSDAADVHRRVPELLAVYARAGRSMSTVGGPATGARS